MADGRVRRGARGANASGSSRPPQDPDEWVPVTSATVDDANTGFSSLASRSAKALEAAGIETQQKPYVLPDAPATQTSGPDVTDRIRVAVLVHYRDLDRARERLRTVH
jgi:hypothetical protein